jgi:acyl-CoA synthetase (AMP-forming)/AMP-acid ligase II
MFDAAQTKARTPVEVLEQRAERQPDRVAYGFLSFPGAGGPEETSLTYGELQAWARAVAVRLRQDATAGDRVLMLCAPGLAYVAHFFGCLIAGLIPVPAYPAQSSRHVTRLAAIAEACSPRIVLADGLPDGSLPAGMLGSSLDSVFGVDRERPNSVVGVGRERPTRARWVVADQKVPDDRRQEPALAPSGPESVAFLQFTSGSTATPKGVMVTHANLMANVQAQARALGLDSETVAVSWLPLHHDMGLIGNVIAPLVIGFPVTLMAPVSFVRSPQRWLEAISEHRATASSAPTFAYRMCTEQVGPDVKDRLDLSRWAVALAGAEPVRPEVLDGFADAFGRCGFRRSSFVSAYGLAESTLIVSAASGPGGPPVRHVAKEELDRGAVRPPTNPDATRALVSSGRAVSGLDIAVVDPGSGRRVPQAQVGEIWVRGDSVAAGYWQAPQATAETFGAVLATGEGPYLRTGDLGALLDGELFVTGRRSDLMIFRGRNVYPQDIETTAADSYPGLATVRNAAFSVDRDADECLVVVQETPSTRISAGTAADIAAAIRTRIAQEHELTVHEIVLVGLRKIPVTSSGKVQRRACRALYLDGALTPPKVMPDVAELPQRETGFVPATTATERLIAALWQEHLALDTVGVHDSFFALGGNSITGNMIMNQLADHSGLTLPPSTMFEHPTIAELAAFLDASAPPESPEPTAAAVTPTGPTTRTLSVQQRRWLHLAGEARVSAEVTPVTFHMALNRTLFLTALRQVVQRHETLRYRYTEAAAQMLPAEQVIPDEAELFADLTEIPTAGLAAAVEQRIGQCRAAVPDPFVRPPWAVRCLELTPDRFMVLLGMRHLEFDATGITTFFNELQRIYLALLDGTQPHLPKITQYREYVREQDEYLAGPIEHDRAYFQGLFTSVTATTRLPGHPGFDRTTSAPARCLTPARPLARWSALAAAAKGMMISPFSIILASYAELVATAVGSAVPVISVIRSGRSHARHANTIGAFTAPFPLPIHVHGRTPLELIHQCHQLTCALTERMDYPPADMINTVPAFRGFPADSYFSDVSINFLQFRKKASMRAGDRTADIELAQPVGQARNTAVSELDRPRRVVGLQFAAEIIEDRLIAHYWYHTGRLSERTVRHWAEGHQKIMDKLLAAANENSGTSRLASP